MKLTLKNLHTIIMFCGISGSGKTTKAKQINDLIRSTTNLKSVIISSDDCRKELLLDREDIYHHHDTEMYQVSDKAFELLKSKAELYLRYPYNANVVILDMMNLSTEDRQKLTELANRHCYDIIALVIDYSNTEDYFKHLDKRYDKRLITNQLKKFRTRTLPELGAKRYNDLIRITKKDEPVELDANLDINVDKTYLPNTRHDFIVSDIHECISTFKELLKKVGFNIETINNVEKITGKDDTRIIIAGDYIDKGGYTKETIEFLYNNIDRLLLVDGNHESYVTKWLDSLVNNTNRIISSTDKTNEKMKYYSSITVLENDEELKNKFLKLREITVPFLISKHFIVTHAGCENKYLGKTQKFALKKQRYHHSDRFEKDEDEKWLEDRRKSLFHIKNEAETCHPLHIFGHESFSNNLIYKNKIHIDTGCCHDNRLTGIEINKNGFYKLWSVSCCDITLNKLTSQEKLRQFTFEEPEIELEEEDKIKLRWLAKNKVNFISGTMCPANKHNDTLESIDQALDYYKSKGIEKVMLQIKYMGSRCNVYLFDNPEKSYAVTRNGNIIRNLDLTEVYKKLRLRPVISNYFKENDLELMILDGELMPWSALGGGLIENVFQTINKGISSELEFLETNNFETHLEKLTNQYSQSNFKADSHTMKKDDLYAKYGAQKYEAYKILSDFYMPPLNSLKVHHKLYSEQLDIYAKPFNKDTEKPTYKSFSILKSVKKNGDEIHYFDSDNETLFRMANDMQYVVCNMTPEGYTVARQFYEFVSNQLHLEGVVIKPFKVDNKDCAPYIKVRNPLYLTIIYGYDYLTTIKYNHLLRKKDIRLKLKTSIEEWNIGKELLQIPYKDINENNKKYNSLMTKMIVEVKKEENLDPRL